jgi:hypothetical protein
MRFAALSLLALLIGASTLPASAHHAFSATFTDEDITVEGTVTKFRFVNPHVVAEFTVTGEDGTQTDWALESMAAGAFKRRGWTRTTLKPGDVIRVSGKAARNNVPMVFMQPNKLLEFIDPDTGAVLGGPEMQDTVNVKSGITPMTLEGGQPNISGIWRRTQQGRPNDPAGAKFNETGAALQAVFDPVNDPQVQCEPPGLVREAAATPHPVSIEQYEDRLVFHYEEYGGVRTVYFVAPDISSDELSHKGRSIARYAGDKVIIETTHLLGNLTGTNGNALSNQTTTVETYSRNEDKDGTSTLTLDMTITDPGHLTEPWTISWTKSYTPVYAFTEADCYVPIAH